MLSQRLKGSRCEGCPTTGLGVHSGQAGVLPLALSDVGVCQSKSWISPISVFGAGVGRDVQASATVRSCRSATKVRGSTDDRSRRPFHLGAHPRSRRNREAYETGMCQASGTRRRYTSRLSSPDQSFPEAGESRWPKRSPAQVVGMATLIDLFTAGEMPRNCSMQWT